MHVVCVRINIVVCMHIYIYSVQIYLHCYVYAMLIQTIIDYYHQYLLCLNFCFVMSDHFHLLCIVLLATNITLGGCGF